MSRRRLAGRILATLAGLLLLAMVAGVLIIRSSWFYDRVRRSIVQTVEESTGGRVEIGSFQFDWKRMRAEVRGFVIHGLEPPDRPPLFRAESVAVGLKIVSVLRKNVDIQYLDVTAPHVYLVVAEDGGTNIPSPKVSHIGPGPIETVLKLAIGRFTLTNGEVEVEQRGTVPLEVHGSELAASLTYDASGPLYRGEISVHPLSLIHISIGRWR